MVYAGCTLASADGEHSILSLGHSGFSDYASAFFCIGPYPHHQKCIVYGDIRRTGLVSSS